MQSIATIQELLQEWRSLGSEHAANGVELIAWSGSSWLHTLLPGATVEAIAGCERQLGLRMAPRLRALYRCVGGMSLFDGLLQLHAVTSVDAAIAAGSAISNLVPFDRQIAQYGWKPASVVAFAENCYDDSVYCSNMGRTPNEIVRCARTTGHITERHSDALTFLAHRLSRLDELCLQDGLSFGRDS
jgi:hypothetical protein